MKIKSGKDYFVAIILIAIYIIVNLIIFPQTELLSKAGTKKIDSLDSNFAYSPVQLSNNSNKTEADKTKDKDEPKGGISVITPDKDPNDNHESMPVLNPDNNLSIDEDQVFNVVEVYPAFPGGERARMRFLQQNIKYPVEAVKNRIEGKVVVNFIVERDGTVSNIKILKSIDKECDMEALRVVALMPKWSPGKQSGMPVRVNFNMPINFSLSYKGF